MKTILAFILLIFASAPSYANFEEGQNALLVNFGFTQGGLALGADFEHGLNQTFGVGGYVRMYPDEDATDNRTNGIMALGGFIRPHFNRQEWDFYVSPGFGMFEVQPWNSNQDDEMMIGPSLGIGVLYELSPALALGIEHFTLQGWFGEDAYRGNQSQEVLAKFRFIF